MRLVSLVVILALLLGLSGSAAATARFHGSTGHMPLNQPIVGMAATPSGAGYWLVARDGGIFSFGGAAFHGSTGGMRLNQPIVGMAAHPTGGGYWLAARDGGVFTFGAAGFHGAATGSTVSDIVGITPHRSGQGYWLVERSGRVHAFGSAPRLGSAPSGEPVVGMVPTPSGNGYWLAGAAGGVWAFGDATWFGALGGLRLASPVLGIASTGTGGGYWLVAGDGGVFSFGDARFYGSTGGMRLNHPVVGMASTPDGGGYWLVASDGGVFTFGADITWSPPAVTPEGQTAPAAEPVRFGVSVPQAPRGFTDLDDFERRAGKRVSVLGYYRGWPYDPTFDAVEASAVVARGATPLITWEPWDYQLRTTEQPTYSLAAIARGDHDAYILRWAEGMRDWGGEAWLRFAHEMNGNWYPWAPGVNGNTAEQFVAAWRHVHGIFERAGAHNVQWVWSPTAVYPGSVPLASVYPGDAYVDWMAIDGYNGGTALPWGGWKTFEEIFAESIQQVRQLAPGKPIMLAEIGSTELGGDKAAWIDDFFTSMERRPEIDAFVWFNHAAEADWRIETSPASQQAFARRVADPRYR